MRQLNEIKSRLTAIRKLNRSKDDPRVENAVDSFEEELLGLQSEDNRLAKAIKKATQSDDRFVESQFHYYQSIEVCLSDFRDDYRPCYQLFA